MTDRSTVLFGDSYLRSRPENLGWGYYFPEVAKLTELCRYKSGGAGWIAIGLNDTEAGLTFDGMLEKSALGMSQAKRGEVGYVVISGGINDIAAGHTCTEITNAIISWCTKAEALYPKANIYVFMPACSNTFSKRIALTQLYCTLHSQLPQRSHFISESIKWFTGNVSIYGRGDDIHPNNDGYQYQARLMANFIKEIESSTELPAKKSNIRNMLVSSIKDRKCSGKPLTPDPMVGNAVVTLVKGKDYALTYKNNVEVGKATVIITGINRYEGTNETYFNILPVHVNPKIQLSYVETVYTGKQKKPKVQVFKGADKLPSAYYKVTYENNLTIGTAKVKVTLKGRFEGSAIASFQINPKPITLGKLKPTADSIQVTWISKSKLVTGYQLQISTSKQFAKSKTSTVNIKKKSIYKKTIDKLSKGKRYYVKARAFTRVNKKNYFSEWSAIKSVKTSMK